MQTKSEPLHTLYLFTLALREVHQDPAAPLLRESGHWAPGVPREEGPELCPQVPPLPTVHFDTRLFYSKGCYFPTFSALRCLNPTEVADPGG